MGMANTFLAKFGMPERVVGSFRPIGHVGNSRAEGTYSYCAVCTPPRGRITFQGLPCSKKSLYTMMLTPVTACNVYWCIVPGVPSCPSRQYQHTISWSKADCLAGRVGPYCASRLHTPHDQGGVFAMYSAHRRRPQLAFHVGLLLRRGGSGICREGHVRPGTHAGGFEALDVDNTLNPYSIRPPHIIIRLGFLPSTLFLDRATENIPRLPSRPVRPPAKECR
ncbi:hypothetical protein F4780DRAFT_34208 [Xylariomycetidae sp. FL0641]|nr:hypothetical protein F4780DRAFT_34208 [Xylariomycetidae sp. FL0641]